VKTHYPVTTPLPPREINKCHTLLNSGKHASPEDIKANDMCAFFSSSINTTTHPLHFQTLKTYHLQQ
jgi:hypothetical protein